MKRKQFTSEKIIGLLRQAEVELAQVNGSARSAAAWASRNGAPAELSVSPARPGASRTGYRAMK